MQAVCALQRLGLGARPCSAPAPRRQLRCAANWVPNYAQPDVPGQPKLKKHNALFPKDKAPQQPAPQKKWW